MPGQSTSSIRYTQRIKNEHVTLNGPIRVGATRKGSQSPTGLKPESETGATAALCHREEGVVLRDAGDKCEAGN